MHNASQVDFWNGETGNNWVTHDALMETMLQPLGEIVIEALAPIAGERVLDIGCGCGHTSLSLADRVGAQGAITGIDISAPMLSVARTLAENRAEPSAAIEFVQADAQTHAIQRDSFDAVFSRFGVMFFEDPVAAFSNIRTAIRPNGRLGFCCWQPRAVNPDGSVPWDAPEVPTYVFNEELRSRLGARRDADGGPTGRRDPLCEFVFA